MADVNGEGCFTYAAFLILDGDNHGSSLVWAVIRIQDFSGFTISLISGFTEKRKSVLNVLKI